MTSGQETERVNSYNPGARTGPISYINYHSIYHYHHRQNMLHTIYQNSGLSWNLDLYHFVNKFHFFKPNVHVSSAVQFCRIFRYPSKSYPFSTWTLLSGQHKRHPAQQQQSPKVLLSGNFGDPANLE